MIQAKPDIQARSRVTSTEPWLRLTWIMLATKALLRGGERLRVN